ncbi:glycoside hydrolase family 97 protein [Solitalea koreensis]|uniref:Alpha-glucosidase n=1 Tax=Solitalea koreensis TaxID=543615 RepID=A0A521C038_9SPHI|nr:glycoside hydrolase family 97 protein [Solitalea koreensis]SMO52191.1 alpha-glucosidase [Solitalea koreensis]
MSKIISFLLCFIVYSVSTFAQQSKELSSPDGKLVFSFNLSKEGEPTYAINYQQKPLVLSSALGVNGWEKGLVLSDVALINQDTLWKPAYGERSMVRDHYAQMTITLLLNNNERSKLQIQVRAYNEGIAFRYLFPEHPQGGMDISIKKELTEFTMPEGVKAWFTNRAQGTYSLLPLNNWPDESERPLVLQLADGRYACLSEAAMVNYSRTKFTLNPNKANTISCAIYDPVDFFTPFATPWRVVMAAEHAGELLANNDLLLNLNPPCEINNTSWIQPGKVMREMTLSMKGSKELVDFAVKRHLQYIHFDAGWYGYEYVTASNATKVNVDPRRNPKSDLDLQEVIRYANDRGIGVFLYVNQRALYQQLDELLPLFEKWGVRGVKFGFVEVGSHKWTTWLHDAVKKCAKYHLMVDIHDEYRPTGFSRTYPNLLTQEGIRGNEEMPDATHNATLPFTRFIAGAADYTICYYHRPELKASLQNTQAPRSLKTTSGHQMALSTIFYSPLQFMYWYDAPSNSQDEPELEYFDKISTVWDDTKVLNGEIAKYITVARRKGEEWFVGTITNNDARELKVPLNFLTPGKKYEASIYYDDSNSKVRTKVSIKRIKVDASTVLDTKLIASGGQAIWIKRI